MSDTATETSTQDASHLNRVAKVEEVLSFIRELTDRYEFPDEESAQIASETATIERRAKDHKLYLGIVGEFSTGKSTFINALLGFELLKEDVLQGTTCAPTLLVSGDQFRITVSFSDGRRDAKYPGALSLFAPRWKTGDNETRRDKCIRKAAGFLERHTADESISRNVSVVQIEVPSGVWRLPPEIAIVDTPGTNSGNSRHTEVAKRAVHELCDLCAALTSATEPCPRTLVSFIDEALADIQNRCLGIVTQIDKLRPRERSRVVQYVDDRLHSEGIQFRRVFGAAPLLVVHPEETEGKPDADSLRTDFESLIAELSVQLRDGRVAAIDEKLVALVRHLINMLLPLFKDLRDELQTRAEQLERNRLIDPKAFFDGAKRQANQDLAQALEDAFWKYVPNVNAVLEDFKCKDADALSEATKISAIKKLIGKKYGPELRETLRIGMETCSAASISAAGNFLARFHQQFNESFRNLSKESTARIDVSAPTVRTRTPKVNLDEVLKTIRAIDTEDSLKRLGGGGLGAGGGAVVGAMVGGPVGAAVGASIGAVAGLLFNGKDIEEVRTTARPLLDAKFQTLSETIRETIRKEANGAAGIVLGEIYESIDQYAYRHTETIVNLIDAERRELANLENNRAQVEADLNRLNTLLEPDSPEKKG